MRVEKVAESAILFSPYFSAAADLLDSIFYHPFRRQRRIIPKTDVAANPRMIQKAYGRSDRGIRTFIEKALTTKVGTMIVMVMRASVFMRTLRFLVTMEARAV